LIKIFVLLVLLQSKQAVVHIVLPVYEQQVRQRARKTCMRLHVVTPQASIGS